MRPTVKPITKTLGVKLEIGVDLASYLRDVLGATTRIERQKTYAARCEQFGKDIPDQDNLDDLENEFDVFWDALDDLINLEEKGGGSE